MNRRDLLLLRTSRDTCVAELSCERLYMQYQQTRFTTDRPGAGRTPDTPSLWLDADDDEPPAVFAERTTQQLFGAIDRELHKAEVLRVVGTEWLAFDAFRRDVEDLIAAFRRRGGRVEYEVGSCHARTPHR